MLPIQPLLWFVLNLITIVKQNYYENLEKTILRALINTINSGQYSDGAERFLTCGGSIVNFEAGNYYTSTACISNNPTATLLCTGILTYGGNGGFFLSQMAASTTINMACS